MLRIVGGTFRGRILKLPTPTLTRPTTDRARESLFNILVHRFSIETDRILNAYVLDIYAGSGALGLEALSRGAAFCVFLEKSKLVQKVLNQNIASLDMQSQSIILSMNAIASFCIPKSLPFSQFDLVFIDPPYFHNLASPPLITLITQNLIHTDSLIIVEIQKKEPIPSCISEYYIILEERVYGEGRFFFLKKKEVLPNC